MPQLLTPTQKATSLRISQALSRPLATGPKGFLLWTEAAWPRAISNKILAAAAPYAKGNLAAMHGFGFLGDTSSSSIFAAGSPYATLAYSGEDTGDTDTTVSVSPTTDASSSAPASNSWLSDISGAITAATTASLGIIQAKDAQTIFNTNLQRAQQGLPPIPTNPTTYGLPAPTANIGLTSTTQTALLWGVGIFAVALIAAGALGGRRGARA